MSEPPSGTVTFLFTDIEGSTKLWERYPEGMKHALARHDAILRETIAHHAGYVFKTVGDQFCAAFAIATDGLAAALAAQQALQGETWAETDPLRVRMALHTGEVEAHEGDYFGPPVNRVSRLCDAGHGGQVLLSAAVQELVRDQLPPDTQLRDMGERRLKDMTRPEHVFQLLCPGLLAEFPPLRTLDTRPTNLPAQPTALIGREREVAAACALLRRAEIRLLTLTGPGGTGKTRLSLQVAADLIDEFEHGVFFIPLSPIRDPAQVLPAIAQALSVREEKEQPLLESLKRYLHEKRLLLLLDNFEQVIGAAPLVAELLGASGVKVLVTSRTVLRVYGEHEYLVPPLTLPDPKRLPPLDHLTQYEAVALFIARAQTVKPDFHITDLTAPAVAEICARLDGLPLAIELAAARVKLFSPQALLARLDSRLKTLTGGARDLPARQQTLRGAIDWGYDLLEEAEKLLFARIAIFVGGFTLEEAETICADVDGVEVEVLEGAASLLDKSLLRQEQGDEEARLLMLETIREYALEKLAASGEATALAQRHLAYFLALAEEAEPGLDGLVQEQCLLCLGRAYDNLRAALDYALVQGAAGPALRLGGALGRFWELRGELGQGRRWLHAALALGIGEENAPLRAKALERAGWLAHRQGEESQATALLEEALALWERVGEKSGVAWTHYHLGQAARELERYEQAAPLLEESLRLFRELGDRSSAARLLESLGWVVRALGDRERAAALLEESLSLRRHLGDKWSLSEALRTFGWLAVSEGNYERAESLFQQGLELMQEEANKSGMSVFQNCLGWVAKRQEAHARAAQHFEESLRLRRELGDKLRIAWSLDDLARVLLALGEVERARLLLNESLGLLWEMGDKSNIIHRLEGLVEVAAAQGQAPRTVRLAGAMEALCKTFGIALDSFYHRSYEASLTAARAALDEATCAALWSEGQAMTTLEQTIGYALGEGGEEGLGHRAT